MPPTSPDPDPSPLPPDLRPKVRVRLLEEGDSLAHLTAMLHRAYKQHADRGIKALAAFQPEEVTRRRIGGGECYIATYLNKVVGTILFKGPGKAAAMFGDPPSHNAAPLNADAPPAACPEWFNRADVATFSQFAVEPDYQRHKIGSELMALVERRAAETRAAELALSTPEPATWLVEMYERRGYRVVERCHWNQTNYTSAIMSKPI